jgi:hypothetical protein
VHTADVKNVLRVYSIEVAAREKDDLNEDPIVTRLRKVRSGIIKIAGYCRPDCLVFLAFNNRLVGPAMTAFRTFIINTDPYHVNAEWLYIVIIDRLSFNSAFWINASYTLLEGFQGIYDGPCSTKAPPRVTV